MKGVGIESELETLKKLMEEEGKKRGMEKRRNHQSDRERKNREGALGYKLLSFVTPRLLTCALIFLASTSAFQQVQRGPDQLTLALRTEKTSCVPTSLHWVTRQLSPETHQRFSVSPHCAAPK